MKAAVLHQFKRPLAFEDVPRPSLEAGELLIAVEACGVVIPICMSRMETGLSSPPLRKCRSSSGTKSLAESSRKATPFENSGSVTELVYRGFTGPAANASSAEEETRTFAQDRRLQE